MKFLPLLLIIRSMRVSQRAGQFWFKNSTHQSQASLVAQMVKNLPAVQETQVHSLGWEDPLEKEMATQSSVLPWEIPWMEEPGRLQPRGLQTIGHNWVTNIHMHTHTHQNHTRPEHLEARVPLYYLLSTPELAFHGSFYDHLSINLSWRIIM